MPISLLPPLCPHDTSATSPLAGLDITRDDSCQHQWSPLLGTLLFGVPCTGCCWQSVTSTMSPARWALPLAAPCHHLESHQTWDVMAGASEVLSCRASLGWRKLCVTPRPARGASVPGRLAGAGGALSPWQGLHQSMKGVLHKCFLSQPAPGQCLGRAVRGRGWEAGGRGGCLQPRSLFPSTCLGGSS